MANVGGWEVVPSEILAFTLALLAPADLVQCRRVCHWWREVVAAMEARDWAFRFACGENDVRAVARLPFRQTSISDIFRELSERPSLACTCGVLVGGKLLKHVIGPSGNAAWDWEKRTDQTPQNGGDIARVDAPWTSLAPYKERHPTRLPPARWEVAALEKARALELVRIAEQLSRHFHVLEYDFEEGLGYAMLWLPAWIHLPVDVVRPASVPQLRKLVTELLSTTQEGRAELLQRMANEMEARVFYGAADRADQEHRQRIWKLELENARCQRFSDYISKYPNGGLIRSAYFAACKLYRRPVLSGDVDARRNAWITENVPNGQAIVGSYCIMREDFAREDADTVLLPFLPAITDAQWTDTWRLALSCPQGVQPVENRHWYSIVSSALEEAYPEAFNYGIDQGIRTTYTSGWELWQWEARRSAAAFRLAYQRGWTASLREHLSRLKTPELTGVPWKDANDEKLLEIWDRQVDTVDAVKAAVASRCHFSVVIHCDNSIVWLGGLSRSGHLVGALTVKNSR